MVFHQAVQLAKSYNETIEPEEEAEAWYSGPVMKYWSLCFPIQLKPGAIGVSGNVAQRLHKEEPRALTSTATFRFIEPKTRLRIPFVPLSPPCLQPHVASMLGGYQVAMSSVAFTAGDAAATARSFIYREPGGCLLVANPPADLDDSSGEARVRYVSNVHGIGCKDPGSGGLEALDGALSHTADLQMKLYFFWLPPVLQIVIFFVSGFNLLVALIAIPHKPAYQLLHHIEWQEVSIMESGRSRRKRLSRRKDGPAFEFIGIAGSSSSIEPHTEEARVIIRRQAARSGRQKHLRESTSQNQAESTSAIPQVEDRAHEKINIPPWTQHARPAIQPSIHGYETMRVAYNFDITALDSFIDVDLAVKAFSLLQDHPTSPAAFLQKDSSSFLAYLPSRYGSKPFLDDAMHCVAAKAAQMLGHSTTKTLPSKLHMKALRSLCCTMRNDPTCITDIYCATRLLVLYELISEMYKKESSMFEAQEWQHFFDRAASMETDVNAHYWWKFFGCMTYLPGVMKDARALFSETSLDPFTYSSRSFSILQRAKNMYQALNDSHVLYQHSASQPRSLLDLPNPANVESTDRVRLQGFLLYPAMFILRLQATLSFSEVDRAMGEEEAQMLAAQTLLIEKIARNSDPTMAWHLEQRNSLPYSIIRTREEWLPINERGENWEELKTFLAERWLLWEDSYNGAVMVKELERLQVEN
ncbi:hypothetical protein O1611_g535 [Lasiodiplodia mahajangana]|uniref:Uncharacterized protein n=1 Tax=Lasiodiplodia mahajangana TaxID=1108764 RepID=A0ACC2K0X2_9PEZI|nr:hypothetical protein O1611_g535 [Lasiodiplodia mahajangana]